VSETTIFSESLTRWILAAVPFEALLISGMIGEKCDSYSDR
jgi:hypothetical protein